MIDQYMIAAYSSFCLLWLNRSKLIDIPGDYIDLCKLPEIYHATNVIKINIKWKYFFFSITTNDVETN